MLPRVLCAVLTASVPLAFPATAQAASDKAAEPVTLRTGDKLSLEASYFAPRSKTGRSPAALLVHDAGADRHQVDAIAEYLQKRGFGVLTVDLRGHGGSVADRVDWKAFDDRERATCWSFAMRDLDAAADFLRKRAEIHSSNLSVVAIGAGCTLAVRHAIDDENTRAVVLVNPGEEDYGYSLASGVRDLEGLPTLIIASKDARAIADRLQEAANGDGSEYVEVAVMKSETSSLLDDSRMRGEISTWLRKQVTPQKTKG